MNVVLIGAGALPMSALLIACELGAEVLCIDCDPEAVSLARRLVAHSNLPIKIYVREESVCDSPLPETVTHIIIASLVRDKAGVLAQLRSSAPRQAKVLVRYGQGISTLINYPLPVISERDWHITKCEQEDGVFDTLLLEHCHSPQTTENKY
jgi:hypothetical protein